MKNMKKFILGVLTFIIAMASYFTIVNAVDLSKTKGSLTITKYEKGKTDNSGNYVPLEGVTFNIYKVADTENSTSKPTGNYTATAMTGSDGKASFPNLDLGRYLVVEDSAPENVTEKVANFLVDIPSTNAAGNDIIYDVEVEAKNETVYGSIILTKKNEKDEVMKGVTFILQKQNGANWEDYPNSSKNSYNTNDNGQISLTGLPAGKFRFIETNLGTNNGYILDNQTAHEFTVALGENSTTVVTPESITIKNEKPTLTKTLTAITKNSKNTNTITNGTTSADLGDIVSYKVVVDVPSTVERLATFKIEDTMHTGLTFQNTSYKVKGIGTSNKDLAKDTDYTLTSTNNTWNLTFTNANIKPYKTLEITYNAIVNKNADVTSTGNINTAKFTYSNIVTKDYNNTSNTDKTSSTESSVKVYVGGFKIEKRETTRTGKLLSGAVFKIASSKANANAGTFIKDANGNEITLTTVDGKVEYKGLAYGTYYIVETQAPTYDDNGTTKYYNLLNKPEQVTINANSYTSDPIIVVNRKKTILPKTGGIGTVLFTIIGLIFVVLGTVFYIKNRKE